MASEFRSKATLSLKYERVASYYLGVLCEFVFIFYNSDQCYDLRHQSCFSTAGEIVPYLLRMKVGLKWSFYSCVVKRPWVLTLFAV